MAVIITNGTVVYNKGKISVAITEADGVQELPADIEARLVAAGVARYVGKPTPIKETPDKAVATASEQTKKDEPSNNILDEDGGFKDKIEAPNDIPSYSVEMKSTELREIMSDYGIPYKVGMSKADMVAALDEYFKEESGEDSDGGSEGDEEAPPDLEAEEPVL